MTVGLRTILSTKSVHKSARAGERASDVPGSARFREGPSKQNRVKQPVEGGFPLICPFPRQQGMMSFESMT